MEPHFDHSVTEGQEAFVDEDQPAGHYKALRHTLELDFIYSFN